MDAARITSKKTEIPFTSRQLAEELDKVDEIAHIRNRFCYPTHGTLPHGAVEGSDLNKECVYLCGNSLGLRPKESKQMVDNELDKWSQMAVLGHFNGEYAWYDIDEHATDMIARIIGAKPIEVAVMNSCTINLHLMMLPFYRPTASRYKILVEGKAFPSDHFAVESQIKLHGYDPKDALILAHKRDGDDYLRTEDILQIIEKEGDSIAVVMFSGVQYFTGQFFDLKAITEAGHAKGCAVGFDLAHAIGNVLLKLHDWNVDFACWCTYKYLNSGPGGIGGAYLHERHAYNFDLKHLTGWFGSDKETRFQMDNKFSQVPGAAGYIVSNPPVLTVCCLLSSLKIFDEVGMEKLRQKSLALTGYLEALLMEEFVVENREYPSGPVAEKKRKLSKANKACNIRILTPSDPNQRGCQLSLKFSIPVEKMQSTFLKHGIVCDSRKPDVIRIAPAPLYNSFQDVWQFVNAVKEIMNKEGALSIENGS